MSKVIETHSFIKDPSLELTFNFQKCLLKIDMYVASTIISISIPIAYIYKTGRN